MSNAKLQSIVSDGNNLIESVLGSTQSNVSLSSHFESTFNEFPRTPQTFRKGLKLNWILCQFSRDERWENILRFVFSTLDRHWCDFLPLNIHQSTRGAIIRSQPYEQFTLSVMKQSNCSASCLAINPIKIIRFQLRARFGSVSHCDESNFHKRGFRQFSATFKRWALWVAWQLPLIEY